MRALELTRDIFTILSICPDSKYLKLSSKCLKLVIVFTIIVTECLALIASVLFIVNHFEDNLQNCLYAVFQVAALFSVIYMWIVAFILRKTIFRIFSKFQQIYDTCKSLFLLCHKK